MVNREAAELFWLRSTEKKLKQNPKYHEKVSTNYSLYFVIHVHLHPRLDVIQTWKLVLESQSISLFEIILFFNLYWAAKRHGHSSRLAPPVARVASFSRARFTCWTKGASH